MNHIAMHTIWLTFKHANARKLAFNTCLYINSLTIRPTEKLITHHKIPIRMMSLEKCQVTEEAT